MLDIPVTERLKALRLRAGVSMALAAKALGLKTASGYQHYEDSRKFKGEFLPPDIVTKLLPLLVGHSAEGETPVTTAEVVELGGFDRFSPTIFPDGNPLPINDRTVIPIYAAAMGGEGHVIIDFNPIEEARPPEELLRVRGAYGILIVGESMVPAYKPGDIAWVNPHKPLERDTDVVLYHVPPNGTAEAIIKSLIGFSNREWRLRQYQPPLDFIESVVDWPVCHRIVGKKNVR